MSELPALPVTFRPSRTRAVLIGVGIAVFAVITVIAATLEMLSAGERATFVVTGLLFLGVLLLLARPRVTADDDGLTVVNLTTKRSLAWAEILRVNLRAGDPWVHLDLSDGTTLPAMGIQPGIAREQAIADARALRALSDKYGGSTVPSA